MAKNEAIKMAKYKLKSNKKEYDLLDEIVKEAKRRGIKIDTRRQLNPPIKWKNGHGTCMLHNEKLDYEDNCHSCLQEQYNKLKKDFGEDWFKLNSKEKKVRKVLAKLR